MRGAANLLADALATARRAGATGLVIVRADSAYYCHDIIAATRRAGAHFSITARHTPAVTRAISAIPEHAWGPIRYPKAIWDHDEQRWISDAEVADIAFTAFTGRRAAEHITARLIVRRVRRLNPTTVAPGQPKLSPPTDTTRCSPTVPSRCSTPGPPTVITPSSNKSSPI